MRLFIFIIGLVTLTFAAFATKYTISSTPNMTFSPATVTAQVGDTLVFNLSGVHTATRVSQSAWENDGNTSNGGFNFSSSGTNEYKITANDVGTVYYVCSPHASMGMKGSITVNTVTALKDAKVGDKEFSIYPNPTSGVIKFNLNKSADISIYNMLGVFIRTLELENNNADISDLTAGVYLIKARFAGGEVVQRIIKR